MNIFRRGNVNIICNSNNNIVCGGNSTVIVNGQVVNGSMCTDYIPFNENITIKEAVESIFMEANSEDIIVTKGKELKINYSGSYGGSKKPDIGYNAFGSQVTVNVKSAEFMRDSKLEVTIPENVKKIVFKTKSGDIECRDVTLENIELSTMSGDIENDCVSKSISLTTMSGDVKGVIDTDYANVSSTSGDIDVVSTRSKYMNFNNVSGDIDVTVNEGCANVNLSSVSGRTKDKCKKSTIGTVINANTVSGDICVF